MLTNKAKYGLKSLVHLARKYGQEPVLIAEISREETIPLKFLEIILLDLKNHGYLESKKGKRGGYWLAKRPEDIYIGNIVRLLDGPLAPTLCVSLTAYKPCNECIDVEKCNVRLLMKDVRDAISEILDKRTLKDLMNNNKEVFLLSPKGLNTSAQGFP